MKLYAIIAGVLSSAVAAAPAMAQAIGLGEIPKHVSGAWMQSGGTSPASCGSPSLIVESKQADEFDFRFSAPVKSDLHLLLGVPMPQVVGAQPAASFEPPEPPGSKPGLAKGIEVSMSDDSHMLVRFFDPSVPVRRATFTRCAGPKVS
ncbi:MAG TPA: hypothetical protein VGO52_00440 [Hyphomonadaceae bacterium]|jgi:hypothetical protein|nr:hypothetical protein [Hyphomonadaceae bacterium]